MPDNYQHQNVRGLGRSAVGNFDQQSFSKTQFSFFMVNGGEGSRIDPKIRSKKSGENSGTDKLT